MNKEVGIVLEQYKGNIIKGYWAISELKLYLDSESRLAIKHEINRKAFTLDITTNHYTVYCRYGEETAIEVGRQLKKIGFSPLTLLFNDEKIPI